MNIEIDQETLTATIEALRDLKAYYESEAAALARVNSSPANRLAETRIEQADTVSELLDFYLDQ
jgi:hypothetical protein